MNAKPLFDSTTDAALRDLDPAPHRSPEGLSVAERAVASATLERVITSDSTVVPAHDGKVDHHRQHRRWRLATVIAAVTVIALAVGLGLPGDPAYADWSPNPTPLTTAQAAAAMATCSTDLDRSDPPSGQPRLLLAERRGGWIYVLFAPSDRTEASCLLPPNPAKQDGRRWGKFDNETPIEPDPLPEEVQETGYAVGTTKEGLFIWTEGVVGRDVKAVNITTPIGVKVVASVANGRYAAWWPAGENKHDNPQMNEGIGVDATFRDGTTRIIQSR